MIYFETKDHKHICILNPTNIAKLMEGEICIAGNNKAVVCYTPDEQWMVEKLKASFDAAPDKTIPPAAFEQILAEGMKRQQVAEKPPLDVNPTTTHGTDPHP